MSRISTELWKDDVYRKRQNKARLESRAKVRENWPCVQCLYCDSEIRVQPCRLAVTKFCNRACQSGYRTGRENIKNRGRIPSKRAGSGISGRYNGRLFRSIYELSFIVNVLETQNIEAEYETIRIPLGDGHVYIPDFVSHELRTIYEVKYEKACLQPGNVTKIDAGHLFAKTMGYTYEVYTEKRMSILTYEEVAKMVKTGLVVLHAKKNGGIRYRQLLKVLCTE